MRDTKIAELTDLEPRIKRIKMDRFISYLVLLYLVLLSGCTTCDFNLRENQSLNGSWWAGQSLEDEIPDEFTHSVPVPGFIDLAQPGFDSVGYRCSKRNYFWYKTSFNLNATSKQVHLLKFHKTQFGIKVWLNGELAGEKFHNFTPAVFDVSDLLLQDKENELIVRVFADPTLLPDSIVWGHDFEKIKNIPGIYDYVELISTNTPFVEQLQIVPHVDDKSIEVYLWLDSCTSEAYNEVKFRITDLTDNKTIKTGNISFFGDSLAARIHLPAAQLWSPELPQLYRLELSTGSDSYETTFGLREFSFNPETGFAELNGETYFMRGTNICIHRFFEDTLRGVLPWDKTWARSLIKTFKSMNWNCVRMCIGFPPDFWYDLADEEGILIQDEYPVWYGAREDNFPEAFTASQLATEYTEWMRERWNHPSVVIWDAQNESVTDKTGKAIGMVRGLDYSNRPWDNGYSAPQRATDPIETHPYVMSNYMGKKPGPQGPYFEHFRDIKIPDNGPNDKDPPAEGGIYPNPIINNEYAWLWLNRDGYPTYLTQWNYLNIFGDSLTVDEYRLEYAKMFARLTEYWRIHRTSASVMHFCGLGYSRSLEENGFTSDNFIDLENLIIEPHFKRYAFRAFYPIGIMIDRWEGYFPPGEKIEVPVRLINDLPVPIKEEIKTVLAGNQGTIWTSIDSVYIEPFGKTGFNLQINLPDQPGSFLLESGFIHSADTIFSRYEFEIKPGE